MEPPTGWEIVSERQTSVIISKGKDLCLLKQSENPVSLVSKIICRKNNFSSINLLQNFSVSCI